MPPSRHPSKRRTSSWEPHPLWGPIGSADPEKECDACARLRPAHLLGIRPASGPTGSADPKKERDFQPVPVHFRAPPRRWPTPACPPNPLARLLVYDACAAPSLGIRTGFRAQDGVRIPRKSAPPPREAPRTSGVPRHVGHITPLSMCAAKPPPVQASHFFLGAAPALGPKRECGSREGVRRGLGQPRPRVGPRPRALPAPPTWRAHDPRLNICAVRHRP
ncbi:hypothetical protein DFR70_107342 [Nocardia tenerifensis]|uniref:Uncharacterized protein n=1 Tax=Nocardia tenerifensis TaxID=228006 RepID=A0A318KLM9_9NOCA|nr:hypothetical protein DFR70_107342 [Nocardia tenerifensis]